MLKTAVLIGAIGAALIGSAGAHDCDTGTKTASSAALDAAGFAVGTMHLRTSGGCDMTHDENGPGVGSDTAKYYKVAKHVNVATEGGDWRIQIETCNSQESNGVACGKDILYPANYVCSTSNFENASTFYNQGNDFPVEYCLGEAQEKEAVALSSECSPDSSGSCADSLDVLYACPVSGLEVCGITSSSSTTAAPDGSTAAPTTAAPSGETHGCASTPNCGTGAACADVVNSGADYTCVCGTGYAGDTTTNGPADCTDVAGCTGNSCQNGAVCNDVLAPGTGYTCTCAPGWTGADCETAIDYCVTSLPTTIYVGEMDGSNDDPLPHVEFYSDQECENKLTVLAGEAGDLAGRTYGVSENTEYTFETCAKWWSSHAVKVYSVSDTTDTAGHSDATAIVADSVLNITTGSNGALLRYESPWVAGNTFGFFKSVPFEHRCENGAICTPEPTSYTCVCATGYEGNYCQTASACQDSSDSSKDGSDGDFYCINGGTATGTTGSCGCTCADGYEGNYCQTASACQVSSDSSKDGSDGDFYCINGGTATGTTGSCGCTCADGYKNDNCQTDIDECTDHSNPNFPDGCDATGRSSCNTDGGVNTRTCVCKNGYDGLRCQNNINDCLRVDGVSTGVPCLSEGGDCKPVCKNSAHCTDLVEGYACDCDYSAGKGVTEGWNGTHCETSLNDCVDYPCTRGSCEDGHLEKGHLFRTCKCDGDGAGYFGDDCEKEIVNGCMKPWEINYDPLATHDDSDDQCKTGHSGAKVFKPDRKERMNAWKSMQKRKYEKTDRADNLDYEDPSKRMKIRKADRIEITADDYSTTSWTKLQEISGFASRPKRLEVGPENTGPDFCQSKVSNDLDPASDDKCITTMLDDEEEVNGVKTLTKRALPALVGSWQVVGKNISGVVKPIIKQVRIQPEVAGDRAGDDKYSIACWDEDGYTWDGWENLYEGDDFICSKTRHRVLVGSLTDYPAPCVGLLNGGCTSEQKTEVYLSRTDGDTDCSLATKDSDRSWEVDEANTAYCKTLGCTTQQIVDSFTCS